jgi:RNA recognition motif-containing protein
MAAAEVSNEWLFATKAEPSFVARRPLGVITPAEGANDRLFVTKVPQQLTRDDLAAHFARFGQTTDVYLPSVPGHGGHKGIAFISFADAEACQLVLSHSPHRINGSDVVVDLAAPRATPQRQFGAGAGAILAGASAQARVVVPQPVPMLAQPSPQEDPAGDNRLFVTKIAPVLQRDHITEYFQQFGDLTDVYMPGPPGGVTHKGIAFVSFADADAMQEALGHPSHEIHGYAVVVDVAAPRGPQVPKVVVVKGVRPITPNLAYHGLRIHVPPVSNPSVAVGSWSGHLAAPVIGHQPTEIVQVSPTSSPRPGSTGTPVPGRLFITHVPPDVTKDDLQLYFQQFGTLQDTFVPAGKGIAFVSFQDASAAQQVLEAPQHVVKPGKIVVVDQALERPPLGVQAAAYGAKTSRFTPY